MEVSDEALEVALLAWDCEGYLSASPEYREKLRAKMRAAFKVAAPHMMRELVEALKDMLRMAEAAQRQLGMWTKDNPRIVKARAAIAKAEGQEENND